MTKKSIADLLRQEAQNSPEPEGETVIEVTAHEVPEQDDEAVEESPIEMLDQNRAKRTNPTKAELEAIVTELTASLKQAHRKEDLLQQQIAELVSELDEQKTLVQQLQTNLEQSRQLKAELEEAKSAAVHLAAANSKLMEEVNLLNKKSEAPKAQEYKKLERKIEKLNPEPTQEPADFAANSWLL